MKSILIVDDEDIIRKYLRRLLEPLGYGVIEASDGNAAIKQYNEYKPDLVIIDIIMPGKEGIETMFELKQLNKKIKLIVMSGGGRKQSFR
jgi:CheY-like chemotaxis protein